MANKRLPLLAFITLALILSIGPATADAAPCDSLAKLTLANTTITNAQLVPTGAFHLPSGRRPRASVEMFSDFARLPMFCRVQAIVAPSRDSRIRALLVTPDPGVIEVNVHPSSTWRELIHTTRVLYEEARQTRLATGLELEAVTERTDPAS